MKKKGRMNKQIIGAAILASMIANCAQAQDNKREVEKCYGVARAEKNDCAAKDGRHSCAHLAKKDGDPVNWVYVPKGLCEKLVGGVRG
jgi:uncharacterized membrane protein